MELRPLTLLYGKNSAGKSALLRSVPLVADSMGWDGLDALCLEGRLHDMEIDFSSLRWKGRAETDERSMGLMLHWDDAANPDRMAEIEWALWEERDWPRLVVERFMARNAAGERVVDAEWLLTRGERRAPALSYRISGQGEDTAQEAIHFRGLLPELPDTVLPDDTRAQIDERLSVLEPSSVLWLRSLRPPPRRYTGWTGGVRWSLDPSGMDAPIVLAGEPEVRDDVSRWYEKHLGFTLIVDEVRKRDVRVALQNRTRASYDVDLIDTGEGLAQVLPVLTALAMARRHHERGGPGIVAIEEPEAHLHPDLQTALADLVCDVAASARPRIVLETHSEHLLLAVQLQILQGKLAPDDVIVYWVKQREDGRSVAEPVEFDRLARFRGDWPPRAFAQDLELAADIQDARDAKESA